MAEGIRKINEYVLQKGRTLIITDPDLDFNALENGTLLSDQSGNLQIKKDGVNDWTDIMPGNIFPNKSITFNFITDKTLTHAQIQDLSILERNIGDLEITTAKLNNSAVTTNKIADLSITNTKVAENTIANSKLYNKTIENTKIKDLTLTTSLYANLSITTEKLGELQVTTSKLANASVTNPKLGINSVSTEKISNLSVTTDKLANLSVITSKLANASVTTDKIADLQVTKGKLSSEVTTDLDTAVKLVSGTANVDGRLVTTGDIVCGGNITAKRVYNAVYNDLAEGYVPGEELEPGDIVEIRNDGKVYKAKNLSKAIVGVVSDQYADCYGATKEEVESGEKIAIGLIGKVYVKVHDLPKIGDKIASVGNGMGAVVLADSKSPIVGKVIDQNKKDGKVLCLIYPN